jgi:hypothetical protein
MKVDRRRRFLTQRTFVPSFEKENPMSMISHTNTAHAATCALSEGSRQNDVAQAIIAGGGSATVAAAVKTAEVAHYRRIIASCQANNQPYAQFLEALRFMGA